MLRIIRGPFGSTAHSRMTAEILSHVEEGRRSYLIVPEQQTVLAESEMAEILPASAPLCFEVTNFTRFADTVFRALGGLTGAYLDKSKRALIMWRTLTELAPTLTMTAGSKEINAGLVEKALSAVGELDGAGIGREELIAALSEEKIKDDKRLYDKIRDLESITTLFKSLTREKYSDSGDVLDECSRRISEKPTYLSDTKIFIEGFASFTEPQYKLISLLQSRTEVTVLLSISKLHREEFLYTELRDTEEKLKRAARRTGTDVKLIDEQSRLSGRSEALSEVSELLWTKTASFDNICLQNPEEIRIFEASTPFEECSFVASDIKRRVMAGEKYLDFAVIARDADAYAGILDTALISEDIPYFFSRGRELSGFELIKLIYTSYSAVLGGYAREDLLTYAKCGLVGISREECDELEGYISTWALTGSAFTSGEVWSMNPAGYTARRDGRTDEKLLRINETRGRLMAPILAFADRMRSAKTVREHAEALFAHLSSLDCERQLKERAEALALIGEVEFSAENARLWGLVLDALDLLVEVSADSPCDAEGFLSQLKIVFSNYEVSRIPSYSDTVTVGSADMIRLRNKKHVYLIGINTGKFPLAVNESSYFSERDKTVLTALGLSLSPELEIKSARELYVFTRSFCYATDTVTLLYPLRDTRQKATPRAEVIDTVIRLTGEALVAEKIAQLPPERRVFSPESALMLTDAELSEKKTTVEEALTLSGHAEELRISRSDITNKDARLTEEISARLRGRPLALTQSRIDSYVGCPFAYFCKFTVGLSHEVRAEFDASNIGVFVHAVLENFFRTLALENKSAGELNEEEKSRLTRLSAERYLSEISDSVGSASMKIKLKIEKLMRAASAVVDGLSREFSESLFEPRFFELAITPDKPDCPEPIVFTPENESPVYVYGIIDRVDAYKKGDDVYIRVVDYKTGRKEFSPSDLEKGKNLQMFLYLKSLLDSENESFRSGLGVGEGGRLIPAGVIYVKTSVKDVRVDRPSDEEAHLAFCAAQTREGMVLDDESSISAMGVRYTPLGSEKSPDTVSPFRKKFLYTEEGFNALMDTVESSVTEAASGIRGGKISPNPSPDDYGGTRCDRCEYRPICRLNNN